MFETILSTQHGLIMESHENMTNYDVKCAQLLTENVVSSNKGLIPVIPNVTEKYIKKIDDAFIVLSDLTVDADKMTEFFTTIQNTDELDEIPLGTPLKNVNEVGRLKPEYLTQIAKDSARTIEDIINGKMDMKQLMAHFSPELSMRIKKQLVVSNKPITDIKCYIKSQEKPNIVPMDSQAIMTLCIPFLRSFPVKKRELQEEIEAVKVSINTTTGLMRSYTDTAVGLKNKGQIAGERLEALNYYLYNQNRLIDELITFMVFNLITKIDTYTFNINSYSELYRKVLKYNPEGSNVYHESVYEYSLAAADIDSTVNMVIHGNATPLIDWAARTYESAKGRYINHSVKSPVTNIDFILDKYMDDDYPYDDLYNALDRIEDAIETIPTKVKDQFASPEGILNSVGLSDSLSGRFATVISNITNISRYRNALNNGDAKITVLFKILAEMRDSEKAMEKLGEEFEDVYEEIDNVITYLEMNENNEIPNELVRMEMIELVKGIERDYRNFLGIVIPNIIQRYKILEDEVNTMVDGIDEIIDATGVEPELSFNVLAVEACMDIDEIFASMYIESEMAKFRTLKMEKEYGFTFEAEEPAKPEETQETTTGGKKESSSPEVTVDPSKQSDADVEKNNQAAEEAKDGKNAEDPKKKMKLSERFKALIEKINAFFDKVIPSFVNSITAQLKGNTEFLKAYKDAILNRSYNGITLKIYNYFNLSSQAVLDDVGKVSAAVSQINKDTLVNYATPEGVRQNLFGFLKYSKDMEFDDAVRIYYKVGPGQKEVKKVDISNTELKKRTQEMVEFCEDFYVNNGHNKVANEIKNLKNSTNTKVNSLKNEELSDEQLKALSNISRAVMVFTGAVLTGFRNRGQHYMFAIRKLLPRTATAKKEETQTTETNQGEETNEPTPTEPEANQ